MRFQKLKQGAACSVGTQVDQGRYIQFVFILDSLTGWEGGELSSINEDFDELSEVISKVAGTFRGEIESGADFREGIILIVGCGVGRPMTAQLPSKGDPRWHIEFLSAADLLTLSWLEKFNGLGLFRLIHAQKQLEKSGIRLQNINGLLNLIAWQRALDGHLVPHDELPDEFVEVGRQSNIVIEQAGLKELRREVYQSWDPHMVYDMSGALVLVRRQNDSIFPEDQHRPLYFQLDHLERGWPPGVYLTPTRNWWCDMEVSEHTDKAMAFERWRMLTVWLCRVASELDRKLPELPTGSILWRVEYAADLLARIDIRPHIGFEEAKQTISIQLTSPNIVTLKVSAEFEGAHFNVENAAESALVERAVEGFLQLAGRPIEAATVASLMSSIVPDKQARQLHAFRARGFHDHLGGVRFRSVVLISKEDDAALRLGLGWRARKREEGADITGKKECTTFLNSITKLLEIDLVTELGRLDRAETVARLLDNHEAAVVDRDQWKRTASAVIALHDDRASAVDTIVDRETRLNVVFQTTRTLVEAAQASCLLSGGLVPGKWDLSKLMAKMGLIITLGGWSDAMWADAIEARIHINSIGDIQVNHNFMRTVVDPLGRSFSNKGIESAVENYAKHLEEIEPRKSVEDKFETDFCAAVEDEMGVGIDELRFFVDFVENVGVEKKRRVLKLNRSELLAPVVGEESMPEDRAAKLIEALTSPLRLDWHEMPVGYDDRDRQPWRFRRRLSVLRKPLIQIDDGADPTFLVAPGLVRAGIAYSIDNYYRGSFPQWQLSTKMRSWRGKVTDAKGTAFNAEVADKLREVGWQAKSDVNVSSILGSLYKPLGDIDVLAWDKDASRVLVIECKDLQFSKTLGEIADQLVEFRGALRANGKPDLLLRHLRRIEAITSNPDAVTKFLGMSAQIEPEGVMVFRKQVPMEYVWDRLESQVRLCLFNQLIETFYRSGDNRPLKESETLL
jgi:hypothetical protein